MKKIIYKTNVPDTLLKMSTSSSRKHMKKLKELRDNIISDVRELKLLLKNNVIRKWHRHVKEEIFMIKHELYVAEIEDLSNFNKFLEDIHVYLDIFFVLVNSNCFNETLKMEQIFSRVFETMIAIVHTLYTDEKSFYLKKVYKQYKRKIDRIQNVKFQYFDEQYHSEDIFVIKVPHAFLCWPTQKALDIKGTHNSLSQNSNLTYINAINDNNFGFQSVYYRMRIIRESISDIYNSNQRTSNTYSYNEPEELGTGEEETDEYNVFSARGLRRLQNNNDNTSFNTNLYENAEDMRDLITYSNDNLNSSISEIEEINNFFSNNTSSGFLDINRPNNTILNMNKRNQRNTYVELNEKEILDVLDRKYEEYLKTQKNSEMVAERNNQSIYIENNSSIVKIYNKSKKQYSNNENNQDKFEFLRQAAKNIFLNEEKHNKLNTNNQTIEYKPIKQIKRKKNSIGLETKSRSTYQKKKKALKEQDLPEIEKENLSHEEINSWLSMKLEGFERKETTHFENKKNTIFLIERNLQKINKIFASYKSKSTKVLRQIIKKITWFIEMNNRMKGWNVVYESTYAKLIAILLTLTKNQANMQIFLTFNLFQKLGETTQELILKSRLICLENHHVINPHYFDLNNSHKDFMKKIYQLFIYIQWLKFHGKNTETHTNRIYLYIQKLYKMNSEPLYYIVGKIAFTNFHFQKLVEQKSFLEEIINKFILKYHANGNIDNFLFCIASCCMKYDANRRMVSRNEVLLILMKICKEKRLTKNFDKTFFLTLFLLKTLTRCIKILRSTLLEYPIIEIMLSSLRNTQNIKGSINMCINKAIDIEMNIFKNKNIFVFMIRKEVLNILSNLVLGFGNYKTNFLNNDGFNVVYKASKQKGLEFNILFLLKNITYESNCNINESVLKFFSANKYAKKAKLLNLKDFDNLVISQVPIKNFKSKSTKEYNSREYNNQSQTPLFFSKNKKFDLSSICDKSLISLSFSDASLNSNVKDEIKDAKPMKIIYNNTEADLTTFNDFTEQNLLIKRIFKKYRSCKFEIRNEKSIFAISIFTQLFAVIRNLSSNEKTLKNIICDSQLYIVENSLIFLERIATDHSFKEKNDLISQILFFYGNVCAFKNAFRWIFCTDDVFKVISKIKDYNIQLVHESLVHFLINFLWKDEVDYNARYKIIRKFGFVEWLKEVSRTQPNLREKIKIALDLTADE